MKIGHSYTMPVIERQQTHINLDGGELGPIPVPISEAGTANVGDELQAFIFTDTNGKPLGTTQTPLVQRDQCACLKVVAITGAGAFLDWGLAKNLLLPFAEQRRPLEEGRFESVLVYLDNSGRLAASSRIDHHIPETATHYRPWQPVSLLIYQRTDLGLKAVVDNCAIGLLYKDEIFKSVRVGETHAGFIKRLRHDGRIDLALQPPSKQLQPDLTETIMAYLADHQGQCELNDKSSPEAIAAVFQVSKKNFKKALATLYRERRIIIESDRIRIAPESAN